ncbi:MAG: dynamin family protein [Oscillospiraceae bacterium]|nr:dynamin family protein [Oscillospiraceae bacterium]
MDSSGEKQLAFLREITRCCSSEDEFEKNISSVKNVMQKYLPELCHTHPELCAKLESAYERLKEYSAYRQLINKNIVSLCGKASSGKSSFFNSLYSGGILPVDTDENSAVPAYVICGSSQYVYGLNKFDHFVTMNPEDAAAVFSGSENDDMSLGHLFSSILTYASSPELKHIAFMDTPGYTKNTSGKISSDEQKIIQRINTSNYILWFADINISTLGISDNDIRILRKTDPAIPKLIIISKADALGLKDMPEIIEKTKKILSARGVDFIDVLTYSKNHPEKYDKYKILAYLDRWDKSPSVISFSQEFDKIFDSQPNTKIISEFRAALMPEIHTASGNILDIPNAFGSRKTRSSAAKQENDFVSVESAQKPVNRLKNIDMSKIKITDLPVPNPEKLFRSFNDRNMMDMSAYERYINAVSIVLSDKMKDIKPVFSASSRMSDYKREISSVISTMFSVPDEPAAAASKNEEAGQDRESKNDEHSARSKRRGSTRSRRGEPEPELQAAAETEEKQEAVPERPSRRERSSSLPSRRRLR